MWIVGGRRKKALFDKAMKERKEMVAKMTIAPRDDWTLEEIAPHTGGTDEDPKPILFAAKDRVFNVWRGRHFYGCNGGYHCFAGKDATIMLALELLVDPTPEEEEHPYSRAELSTLDGWFDTMAWKYDDVGKLAPGQGTWEQEPARLAKWAEKRDSLTPSIFAAAAVILSLQATTHIPTNEKKEKK